MLAACLIRVTPRPQINFLAIVWRAALCWGYHTFVSNLTKYAVQSNIYATFMNAFSLVMQREWEQIRSGEAFKNLYVGMQGNLSVMKATMGICIPLMNGIAILSLLWILCSKAVNTLRHANTNTWSATLCKFLAYLFTFMCLIVIQRRDSSKNIFRLEMLQALIQRQYLPGIDLHRYTMQPFLKSLTSILGDAVVVDPPSIPFKALMGKFNGDDLTMNGAQSIEYFHYIRETQNESWIVLPYKYGKPYNPSTPMRYEVMHIFMHTLVYILQCCESFDAKSPKNMTKVY